MAMKKEILERYRRDARGKLVVDIAAAKVNDLYDDFDRQAPFVRKELDDELVEYLIESARELGREPFGINFSLGESIDEAVQRRVGSSINSYFDYLIARNTSELRVAFRTALTLFALGLAMLSGSFYLNSHFDLVGNLFDRLVADGLVIASWVSMWEAMAGILLNWQPTVRQRLVFRRLRNAAVTFDRLPEPTPAEESA